MGNNNENKKLKTILRQAYLKRYLDLFRCIQHPQREINLT